MNIIKSFLTQNDCYKAGKKITVKGIMLHSVGCNQPSAEVFVKSWNRPGLAKCVHAFLEPNGNVYQTLPWDMRGWHAGGSANNTHIGVEMTEPACIRYTGRGSEWIDNNPTETKKHVLETYKVAVELFAYLCEQFNLNPLQDGVIISHSEGYKRGIASNHGDVEHIWRKFGLTMEQFRKDVKEAMDKKSPQETKPSTPISEKPVENKPANDTFLVKVTADALNIRKGPGTNYSITGVIKDKGVYTIVETKDTWGKLKSGEGWISLKYTERLDKEPAQTQKTLKVGSKVKVKKGAKTFDGKNLASFVYDNIYDVIQINGSRVVIGKGKSVTAAIHKDNLILL